MSTFEIHNSRLIFVVVLRSITFAGSLDPELRLAGGEVAVVAVVRLESDAATRDPGPL